MSVVRSSLMMVVGLVALSSADAEAFEPKAGWLLGQVNVSALEAERSSLSSELRMLETNRPNHGVGRVLVGVGGFLFGTASTVCFAIGLPLALLGGGSIIMWLVIGGVVAGVGLVAMAVGGVIWGISGAAAAARDERMMELRARLGTLDRELGRSRFQSGVSETGSVTVAAWAF